MKEIDINLSKSLLINLLYNKKATKQRLFEEIDDKTKKILEVVDFGTVEGFINDVNLTTIRINKSSNRLKQIHELQLQEYNKASEIFSIAEQEKILRMK